MPPSTLLAGKIRLLQRIGRGGMGDVWVARNESTHAEVAVKTLQRSERTPEHDERFRREARLAATVSHRHVVRVFDLVDEPDGTLGLVMELLRGGTLDACLRERGPLPTTQAVAVALAILSALDHVHQKGIVHRDVKPANIFFAVEPDGHVIPKILDFGIAKLPAANSALTVDGTVLGTPHYMAPEQIRGVREIDGRSDMFSLATVLYELLTGVKPFHRASAAASLAAVLEYEVEPDPRIEPRLWTVISRALAKRPYERFATCAEFGAALRASFESGDEDFALALQELRPLHEEVAESDIIGLGGLSSSPSSSPRSWKVARGRPSRTRALLWGLVVVAAFLALALVVTFSGTRSLAAPVAVEGDSGAAKATDVAPLGSDPDGREALPSHAAAVVSPSSTAPSPVRNVRKTPRVPAATVAPSPKKPVATSPGF